MNEQDYITAVQTLVNPKLSPLQRLDNFALGLVGESAELYEKLSNPVSYMSPDKPYLEVLIDELGDIRFYFTASLADLSLSLYLQEPSFVTRTEDKITVVTQMMLYAGKYADIIKKVVYHEHPIEKHIQEISQYLTVFKRCYTKFLYQCGITDSEVKKFNIQKLSKRYPGLRFSSEKSLNRVD